MVGGLRNWRMRRQELMGRKINQITRNCMQWKSIVAAINGPQCWNKGFSQVKASHRRARHSKQCVIEIMRMGESDTEQTEKANLSKSLCFNDRSRDILNLGWRKEAQRTREAVRNHWINQRIVLVLQLFWVMPRFSCHLSFMTLSESALAGNKAHLSMS